MTLRCGPELPYALLLPFHAIGIIFTVFRLHRQWSKRRIWWDDHFAAAAFAFDIVFVFGLIFKQMTKVGELGYILTIIIPLLVSPWLARISIGLSITRICAPIAKAMRADRPMTLSSAWPFHMMNIFLGLMGLLGLVFGLLSTGPKCINLTPGSKELTPVTNCSIAQVAVISAIIADVIADVLLLGVPMFVLRNVKVPRKSRRMIFYIYAATVLSSFPSIAYVITVSVTHDLICLFTIAFLKSPVLLIVCNLLVVVTFIYTHFWKKDDDDDSTELTTSKKKSGFTSSGSGALTDLGSSASGPSTSKATTDFSTDGESHIELYTTFRTTEN